MHVKAKQVAFLGLLVAFAIILIVFASVIETNTLFLLAAGAFLVGIAIREYGIMMGTGFFLACVILGFFLSPNKLYVLTYAGLSFYILGREAIYLFLWKKKNNVNQVVYFFCRFLLFNIIYIPTILLFPQLLYAGTIKTSWIVGALLVGQLAWLVYDKAYEYFQSTVWGRFRKRIGFYKDSFM